MIVSLYLISISHISCPMELVKIKLQNQADAKHREFKGPIDCFRSIYRKEGFRGYYRGMNSTILRDVPSYGAYFASYELFSRWFLPKDEEVSFPTLRLLFCGGLAGVCGWVST